MSNPKGSRLSWSVGDLAMVPLHGVCTIRSFLQETILGTECQMVELSPEFSSTTVKIPTASLESRGVRRLLSAEDLEGLLQRVPGIAVELPTGPPHKRLAGWVTRLRAEGPGIRHRILRELSALHSHVGKLSSEERDLQDRLVQSLRREMELALRLSPSAARRRLNRALSLTQVPEVASKQA